jgi:hypothetical protein
MKIGHISILRNNNERKIKPISRTSANLSDSEHRRREMREAEELYRREISRGSKLRLYNAKGILIEEAE